jgi:hypothetical protein
MNTTPSRAARSFLRFAVAVAALGFTAAAFAQDLGMPLDPAAWGSNPALAIAAVAGIVAYLRSMPWASKIDGAALVGAFTLAVGAALGAFVQVVGALTVEPYAAWTMPLGGLAYGALAGLSAVLGMSLFNYGAAKLRKTATESVTEYLFGLLRQKFGGEAPAGAVAALAPIISEYGGLLLTDDLRATLQVKVMNALRSAGQTGVDL